MRYPVYNDRCSVLPVNSSLLTITLGPSRGFYVRIALFRVITQPVTVIPYLRFSTTCRSDIEGSRIQAGCPETSVGNYHYSLRNDPEERSSHLLRGRSLKSHRDFTCCLVVGIWPEREREDLPVDAAVGKQL